MTLMQRRQFLRAATAALVSPMLPPSAWAQQLTEAAPQVAAFVARLRDKHGFLPAELNAIFARLTVNKKVLALTGGGDATTPPPRKVYWREYRKNRLGVENIQRGVRFLRDHRDALARAEAAYGVPAAVITAIIGVETRYGTYLGDFLVVEALSTLAFLHPSRSAEFEEELLNFLLYVREAQRDPLSISGSYAGAFGIPQFLPSSVRRYAVDFDGDGKINLFAVADAVGSVGSFLRAHGWRAGVGVAYPVTVAAAEADALITDTAAAGYQPVFSMAQLRARGVRPQGASPPEERLMFIDLENRYDTEYRVGTDNFYALTRYNKSFKYAAAVADLAAGIAAAR